MLTSYKSLAYLVSSVNEEECRAFDHVKELGEPWMEMNFTTKKNSPKKEELCMLNIYSKLQKTKEDLKQLLEDVEKRIEELHTSE